MNINTANLSLSDFDLTIDPSGIMSFHDPLITVNPLNDKQIFVTYLSDDECCDSPFDSFDLIGSIHTARSHDTDGHKGMQEALALNSDWEPNLDLVRDHQDYMDIWTDDALASPEFHEFCEEHKDQYSGCMRETAEIIYDSYRDHEFVFSDESRLNAWKKLKSEGKIGNPFAVNLDCYSHSGEHWSISGTGYNCQFDTAKGAGVWVPNKELEETVNELAIKLCFGDVEEIRLKSKTVFQAKLTCFIDGAGAISHHDSFMKAVEWIENYSSRLPESRRNALIKINIAQAKANAAKFYAEGALELYNAWLSGDVYVISSALLELQGDDWEELDYDCVGGFYTSEDAISQLDSMQSEFIYTVNSRVEAA